MELKELETYWNEKYPAVSVILWENESPSKYFGRMRSHDSSQDLAAATIGELISHGEMFLRKAVK